MLLKIAGVGLLLHRQGHVEPLYGSAQLLDRFVEINLVCDCFENFLLVSLLTPGQQPVLCRFGVGPHLFVLVAIVGCEYFGLESALVGNWLYIVFLGGFVHIKLVHVLHGLCRLVGTSLYWRLPIYSIFSREAVTTMAFLLAKPVALPKS